MASIAAQRRSAKRVKGKPSESAIFQRALTFIIIFSFAPFGSLAEGLSRCDVPLIAVSCNRSQEAKEIQEEIDDIQEQI